MGKATVVQILLEDSLTTVRESLMDGLRPSISDLQNCIAVGFIRRFQNTPLRSTVIGAEPQQVECTHFHFPRNECFSHSWPRMYCF